MPTAPAVAKFAPPPPPPVPRPSRKRPLRFRTCNMVPRGKRAVDIRREGPTIGSRKALVRIVAEIKNGTAYAGREKWPSARKARVRRKQSGSWEGARRHAGKDRQAPSGRSGKPRKIAKTAVQGVLKNDIKIPTRSPYKTFRMSPQQKTKRHERSVEMETAFSGEAGGFRNSTLGDFGDRAKKCSVLRMAGETVEITGFGLLATTALPFARKRATDLAMELWSRWRCANAGLADSFSRRTGGISGDACKKATVGEFTPRIRMKMASRPEPNRWRRHQRIAPSHGERPVKTGVGNRELTPDLLQWVPKGPTCRPWILGFWDTWAPTYRSIVARKRYWANLRSAPPFYPYAQVYRNRRSGTR